MDRNFTAFGMLLLEPGRSTRLAGRYKGRNTPKAGLCGHSQSRQITHLGRDMKQEQTSRNSARGHERKPFCIITSCAKESGRILQISHSQPQSSSSPLGYASSSHSIPFDPIPSVCLSVCLPIPQTPDRSIAPRVSRRHGPRSRSSTLRPNRTLCTFRNYISRVPARAAVLSP